MYVSNQAPQNVQCDLRCVCWVQEPNEVAEKLCAIPNHQPEYNKRQQTCTQIDIITKY